MTTSDSTASTAPIASASGPDTVRERVRAAIDQAWAAAEAAGALPSHADDQPQPSVEVERPAKPEHGDLASNLAMKLARPLRRPPLAIATAIVDALVTEATDAASPIAEATVAPPGFINPPALGRPPRRDDRRRPRRSGLWGRITASSPRIVNVEFVSANPTGPLTIGNARGAFVGDLLCRVLAAGGQQVTREYYFNDSGGPDRPPRRVDPGHPAGRADPRGRLPRGLRRRPCRGSAGRRPGAADADGHEADRALGHWAAGTVREGIEASLDRLGVHFDVWKSEGSLHAEGWVRKAIDRLRERGHLYEQDGATWFRSTTFGDDKDRVVIRSNGEPTYFAADIGYLAEKFSRGFDHIIYVWGIDHHGYIARTRGAAAGLGIDPDHVQVLLTGWVSVIRDGQVVAMSKRAGDIYLLDTLLDDIGVDAARWFFASRGANLDIDIDVDLARSQTSENPVYYVQYAHARIASILRKAAVAGLTPGPSVAGHLAGAPNRRWRGRSSGSPRSSRTRPGPRRRTASPPTRPSSRPSSTLSTATPGWSIRRSPNGRRRALPSSRRRGLRWRTRSGCSGSALPTRCRSVPGVPPARLRAVGRCGRS
jgi:arginyl-tRNA synthetase